jgi:uncharacterized membrane protein
MENLKMEMNFFLTLFALLFFDFLWITFVVGPRFNPMVKDIQGKSLDVNVYKGILAYAILFAFAYNMIPKMNDYTDTFLLGFFAYAIYETTSFAIFEKWDPVVVILDSLWGGVLLCLLRYFCLQPPNTDSK